MNGRTGAVVIAVVIGGIMVLAELAKPLKAKVAEPIVSPPAVQVVNAAALRAAWFANYCTLERVEKRVVSTFRCYRCQYEYAQSTHDGGGPISRWIDQIGGVQAFQRGVTYCE